MRITDFSFHLTAFLYEVCQGVLKDFCKKIAHRIISPSAKIAKGGVHYKEGLRRCATVLIS
jgi:hypothetical protein